MKGPGWRQSHVLAVREQLEELPQNERSSAADVPAAPTNHQHPHGQAVVVFMPRGSACRVYPGAPGGPAFAFVGERMTPVV